MGPVSVTCAILLFLTITILGCCYTFIYTVQLLSLVTYYLGKILWFLSTSIVLFTSVVIVLTVTYLAVMEIISIWKPKERVEAAPRIFKEADCVICKESKSQVLYVPCMHFCTCQDCAKMMGNNYKKCPICRERIQEKYVRMSESIENGEEDEESFYIW